jgi:ribosomal protein S18 acetylase RimI-like enzyme
MAVMPAWRGQGVGSRLLAALLDAAAGRYATVSLNVQADNPAARLYRRFGFEVVEDGGAWFTMRKPLRGV